MKTEVKVVYGSDASRLQDAFRLLAGFFEEERAAQQAGQQTQTGGGDR